MDVARPRPARWCIFNGSDPLARVASINSLKLTLLDRSERDDATARSPVHTARHRTRRCVAEGAACLAFPYFESFGCSATGHCRAAIRVTAVGRLSFATP